MNISKRVWEPGYVWTGRKGDKSDEVDVIRWLSLEGFCLKHGSMIRCGVQSVARFKVQTQLCEQTYFRALECRCQDSSPDKQG